MFSKGWIVFYIACLVFGCVLGSLSGNVEIERRRSVTDRIAYLEGRVDALSVRIDNLEKED